MFIILFLNIFSVSRSTGRVDETGGRETYGKRNGVRRRNDRALDQTPATRLAGRRPLRRNRSERFDRVFGQRRSRCRLVADRPSHGGPFRAHIGEYEYLHTTAV